MEKDEHLVSVEDGSLNGYEDNCLYENVGGEALENVAYHEGADFTQDGRAIVRLDIENDGDLDVYIANYERRGTLMRNDAPSGNWLQVKLVGTTSNRDAVGAHLTATIQTSARGSVTQVREVRIGEAYLSGGTLVQQFGLADATVVDELVVRWPSGRVDRLSGIAANQKLRLVEGEVGDGGTR